MISTHNSLKTFDLNKTIFKLIDPNFFDFLKKTDRPDESVRANADVIIEWSPENPYPSVIVEDLAISEDAQLFYQMYADQMVEMS